MNRDRIPPIWAILGIVYNFIQDSLSDDLEPGAYHTHHHLEVLFTFIKSMIGKSYQDLEHLGNMEEFRDSENTQILWEDFFENFMKEFVTSVSEG